MSEDGARPMAWEPVPLSVFGESLPSAIRSCWVFILRAGATTGAERHPNSHQRTMSYQAAGDLQTWGQGSWESHLLVSEARATLEQRWVSVPPNVWHQAVVPGQDWVVVSFHTVAAEELIEERHDPADHETIRQNRYLSRENSRPREFQPADLARVRQLICHTIDLCYTGVYPPRAVQFFKQFHSDQEILARNQSGVILVLEREGAIVATGALIGHEILGVFVDPPCQGRGYGRAVMLDLEARARANGCHEVKLSVSLPSKGFYDKLGYQVVEECSIAVGEDQTLRFWKARKGLEAT
jgi:ribosomal protein S18 acetylase RimI-like enzyme